MKKYYVNKDNLFMSCVAISDSDFEEISENEYKERMALAFGNRAQGVSINPDASESENLATDVDYISALESLGVDFGG